LLAGIYLSLFTSFVILTFSLSLFIAMGYRDWDQIATHTHICIWRSFQYCTCC
jgi:hypothetical protein